MQIGSPGIQILGSGGTSKKKVERMIEQRTYGANLRRFFKKARDWRSGKRFARPPHIVLLGDSITGGSWAEDFKAWLCNAYNIPIDNFEIHWYGGVDIHYMLPFIEDILIFPNPDLVLFNEYEAMETVKERAVIIEDIITLIRNRTTADIGICTWSMTATIAQAYKTDTTILTDNEQYQDFNWYRDIAGIYNCELIDFNEAIKKAFDAGQTVDSLFVGDGPHLTATGYNLVHLSEIKKHFKASNDQLALNIPYPLRDKETLISIMQAGKMDLFKNSGVTITGNWTPANGVLTSTTVSDTVEVDLKNIIGVEILHGDLMNADIFLKPSGGSYVAPSTILYNNRPLQYCTEIVSLTHADNWDAWRFKRPFKKGIVTVNQLTDGHLKSGRYTIVVNSVTGETVTCEMFDPDEVSLGTFIVGQSDTFISGNLSFPQKYNGEENYTLNEYSTFAPNEVYEFYVKNNWCDSLKVMESPEMTKNIKPDAMKLHNDLPLNGNNIIEYDEKTGIITMSSNGVPEDRVMMQWYGEVNGYDYQRPESTDLKIVFDVIETVGDVHIQTLGKSFVSSGTANNTITTPYLSAYVSYGEGTIKFRISVRTLSHEFTGHDDVKKIQGLPRGDYTLKITTTTGGVSLAGVKALH